MKDNLEKYIKDNRADFDKEVPNLKVWADIEKGLPAKEAKQRSLWFNLRNVAAAAAVLVMGIGIGWYLSNIQQTENTVASITVEEQYPEIVDMEQFFQKEIKEKITQLASYDYDPLINTDLAELDDLLQELKKELQNVPSGKKQQIIEAMISNYKTRLDILEHVLKRIEKTNSKKSKFEKNGTINM